MKIVIHSLLGIYKNHHAFDKEITMNFSIDLLKFFLWTIIQNNFYVYPKMKNGYTIPELLDDELFDKYNW